MKELEDICLALDDKLKELLEEVQKYQEIIASIGENLRRGYIGLAQIRYAKGRDAVSLWKIPANIEARIGMYVH